MEARDITTSAIVGAYCGTCRFKADGGGSRRGAWVVCVSGSGGSGLARHTLALNRFPVSVHIQRHHGNHREYDVQWGNGHVVKMECGYCEGSVWNGGRRRGTRAWSRIVGDVGSSGGRLCRLCGSRFTTTMMSCARVGMDGMRGRRGCVGVSSPQGKRSRHADLHIRWSARIFSFCCVEEIRRCSIPA
ncbi:hypothetical protein B1526_1239 [Bifidobacterium criceti]|uniref:Uncharacterized protein n=1 Tax=Bifidobacterium criceti TaxID=1960969 RepID=A0A2A2EEZ9_9BIFI|nr:hypothetical protein B1526_1239 [Bifidobacterium criceti]